MSPIGVDEWVARSGDRRDRGSGPRGSLRRLGDARRLVAAPRCCSRSSASSSGSIGGATAIPADRGFNSLIYAILALGLNIVVGWAGLLDLGYIAFFGFGAYGYALFSSHAFGNLPRRPAASSCPPIASIPIVLVVAGLVGLADRAGLAALGGRLPGDRDAVLRPGLRRGRQQRRPGAPRRRRRPHRADAVPRLRRAIRSTIGYYWFALIVLIVADGRRCTCSTTSRTGRAWRARARRPARRRR